ncbi:HNH endonuclease [bacterium]|nr:HNH endonuclease [bacterium]
MNPLDRASVERAGYATGWENVRESTSENVFLFSARHKAEVVIRKLDDPKGAFLVCFHSGPSPVELNRSFAQRADGAYEVSGELELRNILWRAAQLSMSLPTQAADVYATKVADIEIAGFSGTEALRIVKQRIGQDLYREALMNYWGGACAVTGLAISELLRASHAKPWAKCDSDAERLDVFNGFLLAANLDALFDSGLISFDDQGSIMYSKKLQKRDLILFGMDQSKENKLRWLSSKHLMYLAWHRERVFQK